MQLQQTYIEFTHVEKQIFSPSTAREVDSDTGNGMKTGWGENKSTLLMPLTIHLEYFQLFHTY